WPLRRFSVERAAAAQVFASLAAYARGIGAADVTAPEPHTLATTISPLADPHPLARAGDVLVFQALLDEAERIRARLAGLAVRPEPLSEAADVCATRLPAAIGDALNEIADALSDAREPRDAGGVWASIDTCVADLPPAPAIDALLGQLRAAWRTAHVPSA